MTPADLLRPPRLTRAWFVACRSEEVGERPIVRSLWGRPIVLFRTPAGVGALVDRCPHRNVPLSEGQVVGGALRCAYHGWRFEPDGRCTAIPGFAGAPGAAHRAPAHAAREQQGYVWVWGEPEEVPEVEPFRFRLADAPGYSTVHRVVESVGSLHAVAENALDVPHTAFLHGGLFRTDKAERKPVQCVVERFADRVECEYVGEARPEGIVGRILSPSGGTVTHHDRFLLPSIVEVEYRIGEENHILVNAALTPLEEFRTRLFAVVSLRSRVPAWILRPILTPIALRIFGQDSVVLKKQAETMSAFGEQRFVSTEIDLLGPHILKLLQRAARGGVEAPGERAEPTRREVTLYV